MSPPGEQAGVPAPVEISAELWQGLAQPVRDAVHELFSRSTTTQSVKNTVATLAGMNLAANTTQAVVELAGRVPVTVLTALADIADRAPSALDTAITLAGQHRASAYQAVKKIRTIALRNPGDLAAFLGETTPSTPEAPEAVVAPAPQQETGPAVAVARSVVRGADRYAGMRSVTPPSRDNPAFRVTDWYGNTHSVTVEQGGHGTPAVRHGTGHGQPIRIVVSGHAAPADVPVLVAAALAEATAERSGRGTGKPDRLVEGSSGDAVLSVRDHGRAARLLAYDQLLRRDPLNLRVLSQLKQLIEEMGLAPDQDGVADRLDALPDQRMRDVVAQHGPVLDGLPGTVAYLAKQVVPALPASLIAGALSPLGGVAATLTASVLLVRSLVHGLHDRSVAVRDGATADAQYAPRSSELKNQANANLARVVVRALAQLSPVGPPAPPGTPSSKVAPAADQYARNSGLRRYEGALAASTALGVVLLCGGPLSAVVVAGVLGGLVVPLLRGPSADARKKRHTAALKTQRKDALDTEMNNRVARRADDIAAYVEAFVAHLGAATPQAPGARRRPFLNADGIAAEAAGAVVPPSSAAIASDPDPTRLSGLLHLALENAGLRGVNAAVVAATSLGFGAAQHNAEQDAAAARKRFDAAREADRDVAMVATVLGEILEAVAPELTAGADMDAVAPELAAAKDTTPLREVPGRPSGLPSMTWALLPGVVSGILMVGAAFGANQVFGMRYVRGRALGSAAGPIGDAIAGREMSKHEMRKADEKAEPGRASAAAARETTAAALGAFAAHVLGGAPPRRVTGDQQADRILAAQDRAYQSLVDEVRRLKQHPDTAPAAVLDTLVERVVALQDVASKAENLANKRAEVAEHGQERPEAVARNELIAALQTYNGIVPGVTTLPLATLFDGVHAGQSRPRDAVPALPAFPAGANGQVAAVTADRHLAGPHRTGPPSPELEAWSGNEGWALRVAAEAGVPDGRFRPVSSMNDAVARLRQLGPGSRAIVHAQRTNPYSGSPMSGDLVNAVNVDGDVYLLDGVTGALADVTGYADGLSMLITEDNGEHNRAVADQKRRAAIADAARWLAATHQNLVTGSFLTDPAAPGLPPGLPRETTVSRGFARIAAAGPGNEMPSIHAFSDQWDFDADRPEIPDDDLVAGVGVARATAGLATAMLATFGGPEAVAMPEYTALTELLGRQDTPPAQLFGAMEALMEALLGAASPGTP